MPWPEHVLPPVRTIAHRSQLAVLHAVIILGCLIALSHCVGEAVLPSDATHVTVRDIVPPPHVLEHASNAPMLQPCVTHWRVLQIRSVLTIALGHRVASAVA